MRASLEVADIFRAAGPTYRATRAGHLSLDQLKVMSAIETCRIAVMGGHVEACTDCGHWRLGVSAASAVRWAALQRDQGKPAAKPQGGDTRSAATEAKVARIWALYEAAPDITLAELRAALAAEGIAGRSIDVVAFLRPPRAKDRPCERAGPPPMS